MVMIIDRFLKEFRELTTVAKAKTLGKVELELLQYIDEHQPVTVRQVADY